MIRKHILITLCLVIPYNIFAQQRDISYYQSAAHTNSPEIKENVNLQKYKLLESDLIKAQFQKPQVNFTADYILAPFFFDGGKVVSVTSNPSSKATGYDVAITDGGLYAAQVGVTKSLFNWKSLNALLNQNSIENRLLQLNQTQMQHDLEKNVNDQYITVYQLQEQREFLKNTISKLTERLKIVEELVKKNLLKPSDYLALDVELTARRFELKLLHGSLISAIDQLNNLCGINDTAVYYFSSPSIVQSKPLNNFTFQEKFKSDSLSIIAQQAVSNTKYNPQVEVFGNTGLNSSNASTISRNFGVSAGIHLSIPIYDGKQRRITESQSKILMENGQNYRNSYTVRIKNELGMISKQIVSTKESLILLDQQLNKQKSLIATYEGELALGQISIIDYIIALQEYSTTLQSRAQTESNLWLLISQYNYLNW